MKRNVYLEVAENIAVPVPLSVLPIEPEEIAQMLGKELRTSLYDFLVAAQTSPRSWWAVRVRNAQGQEAHYILARDAVKSTGRGVEIHDYALSVCGIDAAGGVLGARKDKIVVALVTFPAAEVQGGIAPEARLVARIAGDALKNFVWGGIRAGGVLLTLSSLSPAVVGTLLLPVAPVVGGSMIVGAAMGAAAGGVASRVATKRGAKAAFSAASGVKELFAHSFVSRSLLPLANMVGVAEREGDVLRVTGYRSVGTKSRGVVGGRIGDIFVSGVPSGDAIASLLEFSKQSGRSVWIYIPTQGQERIIFCEKGRIAKETRGHIPEGIGRIVVREVLFSRPEGAEVVGEDRAHEILDPPPTLDVLG